MFLEKHACKPESLSQNYNVQQMEKAKSAKSLEYGFIWLARNRICSILTYTLGLSVLWWGRSPQIIQQNCPQRCFVSCFPAKLPQQEFTVPHLPKDVIKTAPPLSKKSPRQISVRAENENTERIKLKSQLKNRFFICLYWKYLLRCMRGYSLAITYAQK